MASMIVVLFHSVPRVVLAQDTIGAQNPLPQQQVVSAEEAFALMAAEAEKGNANAMLTLGTLHERGIGTPRNYSKALEWYGKAATAGLAEGYYNVGVCFEIGMGTPVDMGKAFTCFENASNLGLNAGLNKMGRMCLSGVGTEKNEKRGIELLGRAADAGDSQAANYLGMIIFEGGHGQAKDANKAFVLFNQAAEMGNAEAMKNLALFYRDGIGRPANPAQELKWYALARLAGYPAQPLNAAMENVKNKLTGEQVRAVESEAQAWVKAFQERNQIAPQGE